MRPLSPETRDRLHALSRASGSRGELDVRLFWLVAEAGEPAALPAMALYLASQEPDVYPAAARAAQRLLEPLAPRDYVWLDEAVRRASPGEHGHQRLLSSDLPRFEALGDSAPAAWGLASQTSNGYVREVAIEHLAGVWTGAELPFLLLRLNDWVAQVRTAARRAVEARLQPAYAAHFLRFLPLALRLERTERSASGDLVSRVETLLELPENAPLLAAGRGAADQEIRRACFRISLTAAGDLPWDFLAEALRNRDPFIRLWAAHTTFALPPGPRLRAFLDRMTEDRFVPVRRLALAAFADLYPEEARDRLWSALLDPAASIRDETRRRLGKEEKVDFAAVYRKALAEASGAALATSISGLGETGRAPDAKGLLRFLSHTLPKVRRAALRAVGKLTQNEHLDAFEQALFDDAPSVSAEARTALASRAGLLNQQTLWDRFERDERPHVRNNTLFLFDRLGKWDRIYYLLRATTDRDPSLASLARDRVEAWRYSFNRTFTSPSREQQERIVDLMETLGPRFRWLDFYLTAFRR